MLLALMSIVIANSIIFVTAVLSLRFLFFLFFLLFLFLLFLFLRLFFFLRVRRGKRLTEQSLMSIQPDHRVQHKAGCTKRSAVFGFKS
jgi:hypothetical protein